MSRARIVLLLALSSLVLAVLCLLDTPKTSRADLGSPVPLHFPQQDAGAAELDSSGEMASQIPDRVAIESTEAARRIEGSPRDNDLESVRAIVSRLCSLAHRADYHALAWPLVEELSKHAEASEGARRELLVVLTRDDAMPPRVHGSALLALAKVLPEPEVRELALPLRIAASHELVRAGWTATALASRTVANRSIPFAAFRSMTRGAFYPMVLGSVSSEADANEALRALREPLELGSQAPREPGTDVAAELFTRELILITNLGPMAQAPGVVREQLVAWSMSSNPLDIALAAASSFCLAHAAQDEPELVRRLIDNARGEGQIGGIILLELARLPKASEEVLDAASSLLDEPIPLAGHAARAAVIEAIAVLMDSDNRDIRERAAELAIEHIIDPNRPEFDRSLLFHQLAASGHETFYDVATLLLEEGASPQMTRTAAIGMRLLPAPDHARGAISLIQAYDPSLPRETRESIVGALGVLGDLPEVSFLSDLVRTDPSVAQASRSAMARLERRLAAR